MRAAVLGAGAWGTALAGLLGDRGHDVALWAHDGAAARRIEADRENRRYLPGRRLPPRVTVTHSLADAAGGRELVVLAVPSRALRGVGAACAPHLAPSAILICASKGLEAPSGSTLDQVLREAAPGHRIAIASGPTFAAEVARGLPAALVAASIDGGATAAVQAAFAGERLRVYTSDDVVGVALGGALKNVIAIAAGCSDGLGMGNNARAALITRGLSEVGRLAARLGGHPLTLAGLAGLGDLVLTCTGDPSRNRRVGLGLGRGEALADILAGLGQVAEGVDTAGTAAALAARLGVEMPITAETAAILRRDRTPAEAMANLMAREVKPERG